MPKQKVSTWDLLQSHPIAKQLDMEAKLALMCEYVDIYASPEQVSLDEFIHATFGTTTHTEVKPATKEEVAVEDDEEDEEDTTEPSANGDVAAAVHEEDAEDVVRPASMMGMRVVYRFSGRNVLSNKEGVTSDTGKVIGFTDVDGEPWTNARRDRVYPINPKHYHEIRVTPRDAKLINGWLAGTPSTEHPDGAVLKNMSVEFETFPEKIIFTVMNAKRPYVDRFVQLPDGGFDDDQKPTTRLFGEHCFRVHHQDHIVCVLTP